MKAGARRLSASEPGARWLSRRACLRRACLAALFAAFAANASALEVRVQPLPLSEEEPARDRLGPFRFEGALALAGDARLFGGFSGLLLDPDGTLIAVSDQAHWLRARLDRDETGRLVGLSAAEIVPIRDSNGSPLRPGRAGDSESLARLRDGRLLVGFERWHRLRAFAHPGAPGEFFPGPPGLPTLPGNSGIEALTVLDDGRVLAIAEAAGNDGTARAWIGAGDGSSWDLRRYRPGPDLVAVDAAGLPGGGALVLERRLSLLTGFSGRIAWLPAGRLDAPILEPIGLATIAPPLLSDNFEGIAVAARADGTLDVAIVSDDNFSMFQRNLLLLFRLDPAALDEAALDEAALRER